METFKVVLVLLEIAYAVGSIVYLFVVLREDKFTTGKDKGIFVGVIVAAFVVAILIDMFLGSKGIKPGPFGSNWRRRATTGGFIVHMVLLVVLIVLGAYKGAFKGIFKKTKPTTYGSDVYRMKQNRRKKSHKRKRKESDKGRK